MNITEDKDTRYYVEIALDTLKVVKVAFDQKQELDQGQQINPLVHRLFISKGQYQKFMGRCEVGLKEIQESP